ncbi:putative signal transducing protein [Kordia sp.]|uniref:putative signal transducing protein n=1 Tax=Kordia sp. TaxID=1965332 RepID=UPI003D2AB5CE
MSKVKVYASNSQINVMSAREILAKAEINYHEINKMDTAYAGILGGDIEFHVAEADAEKALEALVSLK